MLDINKLKNKKTLLKLTEYKGNNEYINSLKTRLEKEGGFPISPSLAEYVERNFNKEPFHLNEVVGITDFLGTQLKEQFDLKHTPDKVLVETVLGIQLKVTMLKVKYSKTKSIPPPFISLKPKCTKIYMRKMLR